MKVVFLDRDGVINEFPGNGNYVTKVKDFHFIPRALDAIRELTESGYKIIVVSNQAGVSKGVYSQDKLTRITRKMFEGVLNTGGWIDKVYYAINRGGDNCEFRKPGIGFIRTAFASMKKTLRHAKHTYFVGDTQSDIEAGHNAGCRTIFVLSGRETRAHMRKWAVKPDFVARDLYEAAQIIQMNGAAVPRRRPARASSTSKKTRKRI